VSGKNYHEHGIIPLVKFPRKTTSATFDRLAKYNAELYYILPSGLFDESEKFRAKLRWAA